MYSERFANYHANKEFINCQNPAIMDVNLSKKKVAGFLGQSYVLIPRKVLEMLFHGKGRDRSVGMVYLALFSEVFFKDGQVYFRFSSVRLNRLRNKLLANYLKSGGNELATVRISAFCVAMLSNNSFICKYSIFFRKYELSAAVL